MIIKFIILIFFISSLLSSTNNTQIIFSESEKLWLAKKEPINYVYDPNWKPFEWKDELSEHAGIISDIMLLLEEKSGINFISVPTASWSEAIKKVQTDEVSMFSGIGVTKARQDYLSFAKKPLFITPYVLVSRHGEDYLDGFIDTTNKRVATICDSTISNKLKNERPNVKFSVLKTAKDGFTALQSKEIDIFIINATTAKYYLNILGYDDLKIAYKTKLSLDLKIAIRKDMPIEVLSIIDKSIDSISEKEISDIFYKWTEVTIKKEIDWIVLGYILGAGFLIFLFLFLNNLKLKAMVKEQTFKINQKNKKLKDLIFLFNNHIISVRVDMFGVIIYANKAFFDISGYTYDELKDNSYNIFTNSNISTQTIDELYKTLKLNKEYKTEIKSHKKNGDIYWTSIIATPIFNDDNELYEVTLIMHDITDKKFIEQLSITDALTNIYNRRYFNTIFNQIIKDRKNQNICFILLDIDNFKKYNDNYGHQKGDEALVKFTSALIKSLQKKQDYCFRLGGEEFGIIIQDYDKNQVVSFIKTIEENIKSLEIIHEYSVTKFLTATIGVVCKNSQDAIDKDNIFKEADDLLYKAKNMGRNQACYNFK